LQRQRDRPLALVGLDEPVVDVLQLARTGDEVGLDLEHPPAERLAARHVLPARGLFADVVGDLLGPVQDEAGPALVVEDRDVHRTPVALDELAGAGYLDVVLLHGHGVRPSGVAGTLERSAQVVRSVAGRVGRVGRERLEHPPADEVLVAAADDRAVGTVGLDDHEVRVEHDVGRRRGVEERGVVDLGAFSGRRHRPRHTRV
jgi:hypothetical protein